MLRMVEHCSLFLSSLSNFFLCGGWLICLVEGNQDKEFGSLLSSLNATLIQYATYLQIRDTFACVKLVLRENSMEKKVTRS